MRLLCQTKRFLSFTVREILSQLESITPRSAVTAIQEALYRMDRNALQKALETFLLQTISFHDAANEVFIMA